MKFNGEGTVYQKCSRFVGDKSSYTHLMHTFSTLAFYNIYIMFLEKKIALHIVTLLPYCMKILSALHETLQSALFGLRSLGMDSMRKSGALLRQILSIFSSPFHYP